MSIVSTQSKLEISQVAAQAPLGRSNTAAPSFSLAVDVPEPAAVVGDENAASSQPAPAVANLHFADNLNGALHFRAARPIAADQVMTPPAGKDDVATDDENPQPVIQDANLCEIPITLLPAAMPQVSVRPEPSMSVSAAPAPAATEMSQMSGLPQPTSSPAAPISVGPEDKKPLALQAAVTTTLNFDSASNFGRGGRALEMPMISPEIVEQAMLQSGVDKQQNSNATPVLAPIMTPTAQPDPKTPPLASPGSPVIAQIQLDQGVSNGSSKSEVETGPSEVGKADDNAPSLLSATASDFESGGGANAQSSFAKNNTGLAEASGQRASDVKTVPFAIGFDNIEALSHEISQLAQSSRSVTLQLTTKNLGDLRVEIANERDGTDVALVSDNGPSNKILTMAQAEIKERIKDVPTRDVQPDAQWTNGQSKGEYSEQRQRTPGSIDNSAMASKPIESTQPAYQSHAARTILNKRFA